MSELIKRKFNIGIGREIARGTAVAPAFWLKPLSEDINDKIEVVASERAVGVIEDSEDQEISKKLSGGTITGEIFDRSFGLILLATLGNVSSEESVDSGVYNHSFEILQSAKHPTLTLEVKRGDNEQKAYTNSVIESFKLSAVAKDYIKFEAVFRGKPGTVSANIPAYIEENYFLGKDINVKLASDLSGLAGADAVDVRSVELNVVKNIEDDEKLGSVEPNDFLNKQVVMEGNVEMLFKNTDLMNNALNGDKKTMRLEIVNSGITIGSSSNPKLVIDLAKIKFREPLIAGDNNEVAKVTVGFKAFYSSADARSITAILTNEQVNY